MTGHSTLAPWLGLSLDSFRFLCRCLSLIYKIPMSTKEVEVVLRDLDNVFRFVDAYKDAEEQAEARRKILSNFAATAERNVLATAVTCVEDELSDLKHKECQKGVCEICDDCLHRFMQNQTLQRIIKSLKWQLTNDSSKE